jgi:hypothetical protein
MPPVFSLSYWFAMLPTPFTSFASAVLYGFFGLLVAVGLVVRALGAKRQGILAWDKGAPRVTRLCLIMGILGLLLIWFGNQQVYFFGARFWLLVWLAAFVPWALSIVKYLLVVVPEKAADYAERARIEKWLPKRK